MEFKGYCEERFSYVKELFTKNIESGLEVGASLAVLVECKLVVDIWGGHHVTTGPIEATAIGNILMQAKATEILKHFDELRNIVSNSFTLIDYYPEDVRSWMNGYEKYLKFRS